MSSKYNNYICCSSEKFWKKSGVFCFFYASCSSKCDTSNYYLYHIWSCRMHRKNKTLLISSKLSQETGDDCNFTFSERVKSWTARRETVKSLVIWDFLNFQGRLKQNFFIYLYWRFCVYFFCSARVNCHTLPT